LANNNSGAEHQKDEDDKFDLIHLSLSNRGLFGNFFDDSVNDF
jgi:hypothetical protein